MALPQNDRGPAPPALPMNRMQLVLRRSLEQQTALHALLDDQQDRASSNFHKWLIPEEFGRRFGPADQDVQIVSSWLESHGFHINHVAKAKDVIEFSGTAELVRNAFHTEINKYVVNSEEHWANASDPQIPEALSPVVVGVASLHNFQAKPAYRISDKWPKVPMKGGGYRPAYNDGTVGRALGPGDFATIYNLKPLYKAGLSGAGVTIGIVGAAPILVQDIVDFRKVFGLPKNTPQVLVNGTKPDYFQFELDSQGPDVEGTLDVSWSGAIAPGANVIFTLASDTDTTDSVALSEEFLVDDRNVDILSESFGRCESFAGTALVQMVSGLREQAAAQGITWIVSSGDTGPYGCFDEVSSPPGPLTVNLLAASPYVVAVGGTEFTRAGVEGFTYWSANDNAKTLASAIAYPPEDVWNDSCNAAQCGAANVTAAASSGGVSRVFRKPSWQSGIAGIPNDGSRDIPDLSLSASPQNAPYLLCIGGSCQGTINSNSFMPIGGTSAGTPSFAGIMALIDQKMKSRQGAVNRVIYRLAASQQYGNCNGSSAAKPPESTCIFNDITSGDSSVPGEAGYGKPTAKYPAGVAYDLATGLGSLNAANLVNNWESISFKDTNTAFTLSPATFAHGTQTNLQASVTPQAGGGTPTGAVSIVASSGAGYGALPLTNGSAASTLTSLPGGTYSVHAHYGGDTTFAPSDSAAIPVTVTAEASTTTATAFYPLDIPYAYYPGGPYGNASLVLSARVAGLSGQGRATGNVTFTDNGAPIIGGGGTGVLNSEAQGLSFNTNIVFPVGSHSVVATYAGDASFQPSVSSPFNFTITPAQTTTTVQSSVGQAESGKPVTLTATVEAGNAPYGNPETGSVTFFLNGQPLGTRFPTPNVDSNTFISNAIALLHAVSLPQGTNTITATYAGDHNYLGSSSAPVKVTIKSQAPACQVTNFTADPNPIALYDPPSTTTITVTAPCSVDVRMGSPSGTLVGSGQGTFTSTATINATTTFYLQQAGNTTAQGTLQTLTVGVQTGTLPCTVEAFSATPNPIISPTLVGSTTITAVGFTPTGSCNFDIRVGAPNGTLFTSSFQGVVVQDTGNFVTNGMQFFLQPHGDVNPQHTLATLTMAVLASAPTGP